MQRRLSGQQQKFSFPPYFDIFFNSLPESFTRNHHRIQVSWDVSNTAPQWKVTKWPTLCFQGAKFERSAQYSIKPGVFRISPVYGISWGSNPTSDVGIIGEFLLSSRLALIVYKSTPIRFHTKFNISNNLTKTQNIASERCTTEI